MTKLISNQIVITGIDAFRTSYDKLFTSSPDMHCHLKARIVGESSVTDEEWVTGHSKAPEGLHAIAVYGFRDDRIDRVWFMS